MEDLIVVYKGNASTDIEDAKRRLRAQMLHPFISDDTHPAVKKNNIQIAVPREQVDLAREVLSEWIKETQPSMVGKLMGFLRGSSQ